ncbi:hypothetical protein [Mucilaginibacter galii]
MEKQYENSVKKMPVKTRRPMEQVLFAIGVLVLWLLVYLFTR